MSALLKEAYLETLRLLRLSEALWPTIAMPLMFYGLIFGVFGASGFEALAGLVIIASMAPGAFSGAIYVAGERQSGWLSLRWQFSQWRWWLSKQISLYVMALFSCLPVMLLATLMGGTDLTAAQTGLLLLVSLVTSFVFSNLGLICGLWFSESGAIGVTNLLFFPLVLVSGLSIPLSQLPLWLTAVAPWLPPYQLLQLSLGALHLELLVCMMVATVIAFWSMARCKI